MCVGMITTGFMRFLPPPDPLHLESNSLVHIVTLFLHKRERLIILNVPPKRPERGKPADVGTLEGRKQRQA